MHTILRKDGDVSLLSHELSTFVNRLLAPTPEEDSQR